MALPAIFAAVTLALPTMASANTEIRLLVAYTQAAATEATDNNVSCNSLLTAHADTMARYADLTGTNHVCVSDQALGRGSSAIHNLIDIAVAETNAVYANSGLGDIAFILANSVLVQEHNVAYDETFDASSISHNEPAAEDLALSVGIPQQLYKLRNRLDHVNSNDAILNMVHAAREQAQADMVLMLVDRRSADPTGGPLADLDIDIGGLAAAIGVRHPRNSFAVLDVAQANAPSFTFAHEVSHLLGANHYAFRYIPLLNWPQDNLPEFPNLVNGKIDSWGYVNAVENGAARSSMYATIMAGGCHLGLSGWRIRDVWQASMDNDGNCVAADTNTAPLDWSCTVIPVLSSTSTTFSTALPFATTGNEGKDATCVTTRYENENTGEIEVITSMIEDDDSTPRNNARTVPEYAAVISQFHHELSDISDASGQVVAIDFGASQPNGWDVNLDPFSLLYKPYNGESVDADCDVNTGANCDRYWNNVTDTSAGTSATLYDLNHADTGVVRDVLTIEKSFQGYTSLDPTMSASYAYGRDDVATMAMTDGFTAVRLYTNPVVALRHLENASYTFRIYGVADASETFRVARYYLTYADASGNQITTMQKLGTHNNVVRFVEFRDVRPLNGTVSLRVSPDLTVPFFHSVGLSGITYFPSP